MTDRPVLTGARWSEATRCPRMAAIGLLGAIPAAPSDRLERLFERGHDVEDYWFRKLAREYKGRVEHQKPIKWGRDWELHCDGVIVSDHAHIEVKSTVDVDSLPGVPVEINGLRTTSAVLQVVGAAVFDPEGGTAELVTVSPVDYWERRWPIEITPELRAAVIRVESDVVRAASEGVLPDRCCSKPSDAIGRMCPYRDACFSMEPEWQEPEPITLDDERAHDVIGLLAALEANIKRSTATLERWKQERSDARQEARETLDLQPGTDYEIGQTRVKISPVKGRESFDYKAAVASGHLSLDGLEGFVRHGEPGTRWTVETLAPDEDPE